MLSEPYITNVAQHFNVVIKALDISGETSYEAKI